MSKHNKNAKDPSWELPLDLPEVDPEDYSKSIDSGRGSAASNAGKAKPDAGPPDYTLPGYPTAKDRK